jgi:hypothetical protein
MTVGTLAPNEKDLYKIVNIVRQLAEGRSNLISAYITTLLSAPDRAAALTALGISGYSQTLLNAADAAAARVTLGLADTGFSTGDAKITLKTTADPGWLIMNDGTIGSASSGATYQNANAQAGGPLCRRCQLRGLRRPGRCCFRRLGRCTHTGTSFAAQGQPQQPDMQTRLQARIAARVAAGASATRALNSSSVQSYLDPPRTLEELARAVSDPKPGYDIHHIVEKTNRTVFRDR